jgi:Arc/MetJ-type ribon-helix-helix transcriptional regulator
MSSDAAPIPNSQTRHQKRIIMPKKVLIALPPQMLEAVDFRATEEYRTRSDLIRESLRNYLASPAKKPNRNTSQDWAANVDTVLR